MDRLTFASRSLLASACCFLPVLLTAGELQPVRVSEDGRSFVLEPSGRPFVPWGFNYDHDEQGRLIEDYWTAEWPKVEEDFHEMKQLGANVVRIHLQTGKFMQSPDEPNAVALEHLGRLVTLAERVGLYLDLTGLGCYHKKDIPSWYDELSEADRWKVQARFWGAVAQCCADSPAVFCYDLMNEPVVGGGDEKRLKRKDWVGPPFAGKHFVQFIALQRAGRSRPQIARQWIRKLVAAIRKHDPHHLVTVGLVDWSLDRPGLTSGFVPKQIAEDLDFLSVHIYPKDGKVDDAIETLRGFSVGKPVVIEETFRLHCSTAELARFIDRSQEIASGWIGFYWGKTPEEYRRSDQLADALILEWLNFFQSRKSGHSTFPKK